MPALKAEPAAAAPPCDRSRASRPTAEGFADNDGVRIFYEVHGDGDQTLLLPPPWAITHSRFWKLQVPYLARHFRVVVFDVRGNGRSDRPASIDQYGPRHTTADAIAVLAAAGVADCVVVSHCASAASMLLLAAERPELVRGAVFFSPQLPLTPPLPERAGIPFDEVLADDDGWHKLNSHYWRRDFRGFLEFFFDRCYPEAHCTRPLEDSVAWALETDPETLALPARTPPLPEATVHELLARLRCPALVIQGGADRLVPPDRGPEFARLTGAELVELADAGHCAQARHPVRINRLLSDFAQRAYGRPRRHAAWRRAAGRPRRALFVSSPIGLGHVWRDVAIARELRALHPGLQIDWLAQDPVTRVLAACGERIHPASALLASESRHIAACARDHELNVFEAWRRMDEILAANFMVFDDLVRDEAFDVWIGDEAWELDHFLHENPELKTAPFCFLTDFVGWLPLPDGGEREARLAADHNAEMLEQVQRYPRVRDRAIFIGDAQDVVDDGFGEGLPAIRPWVEENFDFCGYALPPGAGEPEDRDALRARLGHREDETVCIATAGGSGVGASLLARIVEAFPAARERIPGLRMVVICGPRIDPAELPSHDGLRVAGYVHDLPRRLAACDVALVQGGLATCMELTAARRPFVYFPLRRHFEQQRHVRHRLDRYGAGRAMDIADATPDAIADALSGALANRAAPADVERGGAARAAALIGELL